MRDASDPLALVALTLTIACILTWSAIVAS